MKKLFVLLLMVAPLVCAVLMNLACNAKSPSSPDLQSPLQTVSALNPTTTLTFTSTPTSTPTMTMTPTPFIKATWPGFNSPSALAVDGSGNIYVADTGNNRVGKYTSAGALVGNWGSGGVKGKILYSNPIAIAVDSSKNLYVIGNGNQVSKYDVNGNLLTTAFSAVALSGPTGLAVDSSNNVYISDAGNQRVVELTSGGASVGNIAVGSVSITGLAVDASGYVFVAVGNTVQEYQSGSLFMTIPGFSSPNALFFDVSGNLWVADKGNNQVEEFSGTALANVPLVVFNGSGSLSSPKAVVVDQLNNIYVANSAANDVVVFNP